MREAVVDLGGSNGAVALEIVKTFPSIRAIVQNLLEIINGAHITGRTTISDHIAFQAQDFFSEQMLKGADVHLFRIVFRGWSDKHCVSILKKLNPALGQGTRILINNFLLPDFGTISQYQGRNA
ncbi:hypothetical protein N7G274_010246, partial [Stereocaulon virgatum]